MFFPALLAKFLSAGAVAQAASGVGIALVAFTGAGATGLLGNDVQTTLTSVVGAADETSDVSEPVASPTPTETGETPAVETPAVETPAVETPAAFDAAAWAANGPADGESFGEWVRQAARAGKVDGSVVSAWAHKKHVDLSDVEGIDDSATPSATPTPEVENETETEHATETAHGNGHGSNGGGDSGHGGRGHN